MGLGRAGHHQRREQIAVQDRPEVGGVGAGQIARPRTADVVHHDVQPPVAVDRRVHHRRCPRRCAEIAHQAPGVVPAPGRARVRTCATAASNSRARADSTTRQPSAASDRAMARPMPRLLPVTTATFPSRSKSIHRIYVRTPLPTSRAAMRPICSAEIGKRDRHPAPEREFYATRTAFVSKPGVPVQANCRHRCGGGTRPRPFPRGDDHRAHPADVHRARWAEAGGDAGGERAPRPRVDNAMVKALARAFRWRKQLDTGVHLTLEDSTRAPRVRPHIVQLRRARDLALTDGSASFGYSLSCLLMIFRVGLRRLLVHLGLGLILERREDWEMVRSDVSEPLQTD